MSRIWQRALREARRAFGRNLFTTLALVTSGVVVSFVPQARNILFHLPAAIYGEDWTYVLSWTLFTVLLVVVYLTLARWVIDPGDESRYSDKHFKWVWKVALGLGLLQLIPGSAALQRWLLPGLPIPPYLMFAGIAAVLAPAVMSVRWSRKSLWNRQPRHMVARFLLVNVFLFFAIGELIWWLAGPLTDVVSYRAYTVWALYHAVFTLVAIARILDICQRNQVRRIRLGNGSPQPVRVYALVIIAGLGIFALQPIEIGTVVAAASEDAVGTAGTEHARREDAAKVVRGRIATHWLDTIDRRLDYIEKTTGGPVVLLAAGGGGSRAAMFTAMALESFQNTSGIEDLHDRILMTSSVSGGSLAVAYYLAERYHGRRPDRTMSEDGRAEWIHAIPTEIKNLVAEEREKQAGKAQGDAAGELPDVPEWLFSSAFVDEMGTSFLAPLMRGVFLPFYERGESMTDFWREQFQWQGLDNMSWGAVDAKNTRPPPPLALFNTTDVDGGIRLVVGFPSLPPHFANHRAATVSKRSPDLRIDLAEAVRVSANFPFGFCPARLGTGENTRVISDGGVVDNTGLDSFVVVFDKLREHAKNEGSEIHGRAKATFARIRKLGALLLIVDSGVGPTDRQGLGRVFPELTEPARALSNADASKAQSWTAVAKQLLGDTLTDAMSATGTAPGGTPFDAAGSKNEPVRRLGDYEIAYHAGSQNDVMTSWSLGPRDKAQLLCQFTMTERSTDKEGLSLDGTLSVLEVLAKSGDVSDADEDRKANIKTALRFLEDKDRAMQRIKRDVYEQRQFGDPRQMVWNKAIERETGKRKKNTEKDPKRAAELLEERRMLDATRKKRDARQQARQKR